MDLDVGHHHFRPGEIINIPSSPELWQPYIDSKGRIRLRPTEALLSISQRQNRSKTMSTETRNFLIDLATFLRGHSHNKAAQSVLEHINEFDADGDPED